MRGSSARSFLGVRRRLAQVRGMHTSGQMAVELAVCLPVILVVACVAINLMFYLSACSRFDLIASNAVRIEAASPGYGEEGSALAASRVQALIFQTYFDTSGRSYWGTIEVDASKVSALDGGAQQEEEIGFNLLTRLERYECRLTFCPWPFERIPYLKDLFALTHERAFTIDPCRPGVLL